MIKSSLEERAKELLRWKITKKGEKPNISINIGELYLELKYLIKRGYVIQRGETPAALRYEVTPEGRKWAISK